MRARLTPAVALFGLLLMSACAKMQVVWRASEGHGDKPGFGIELIEESGEVKRAKVFVLDPNAPDDFSVGRPLQTEMVHAGTAEIRLAVHVDADRRGEFVLFLRSSLSGDRCEAILRDLQGDGEPTALTFVRVP